MLLQTEESEDHGQGLGPVSVMAKAEGTGIGLGKPVCPVGRESSPNGQARAARRIIGERAKKDNYVFNCDSF